MKLPGIHVKKVNYPLLAFLLPFLGVVGVLIVSQYAPFGQYSILYSDMYHQYYPFFVAFRKTLREGGSLLYTWNVGMGLDYLGLIAYYLASPLNLLSVLVPESMTLAYFTFLVPLKLGLAGLFFSLFLKKTFGKNDLSIVLFSAFYALCAWSLGYQWNIMWLDTFALLPLVAMGTVSLLREKKVFLYTVTLFLSVFTNYYVGFFTCIFVLLLFICYEICRFESVGKLFSDLMRIALFSLLAIGMTAILELPALAALQTTQSSVNKFPQGFRLNIADENTWLGLLDAMRQVAGNVSSGIAPTFKEGLPNLHCGVLTTMMGILFFTTPRIKLRDKLCCGGLLLFFMLSFIIRQLDYIWHGLHFTNMIPYRFSFLFSFVLLYMAYRAFLLRRTFQPWKILLAFVLTVALALCSDQRTKPVFWVYNGILICLYTGVLLYRNLRRNYPAEGTRQEKQQFFVKLRERRATGNLILVAILCVEIVMILINYGLRYTGTSVANYPMGQEYTASMVRYMQEREQYNGFFRAETTHSQTLNDSAINGYAGISTFTSSANVRVTRFMKALGFGAKDTYNRYCYEDTSPIANLFVGVKYLLARDGKVQENAYLDDIHHYGSVHLLENNAYLPLGFLANSQVVNVDFTTTGNRFRFQNDLLAAASGIHADFWQTVPGSNTAISGDEYVTIRNQTDTGYCAYETDSRKTGTVVYSFTAHKKGLFCFYVDRTKKNSMTVWLNGKELFSESYSLPQMLSVSDVGIGDVVEIRLGCKKEETGSISISAAILDEETFRAAYDVLNACTLKTDTFTSTFLSGSVDCDRDGVLYTSIPQNGNWHVWVDGQEITPGEIGDAMIGIPLSQGSHQILFRYRNDAFSAGWKISLACVILFALAAKQYYPKKQKLPE